MSKLIFDSLSENEDFEFDFQSKKWNSNDFLRYMLEKNQIKPLNGFEQILECITNQDAEKLNTLVNQVIGCANNLINKKHAKVIYNKLVNVYGSVNSAPRDVTVFKKVISNLKHKIENDSDEYVKRVINFYNSKEENNGIIHKIYRVYSEHVKKIKEQQEQQEQKQKQREQKQKEQKQQQSNPSDLLKDQVFQVFTNMLMNGMTDKSSVQTIEQPKVEKKNKPKKDKPKKDKQKKDKSKVENQNKDKNDNKIDLETIPKDIMPKELMEAAAEDDVVEKIDNDIKDFDKNSSEDIQKKLLLDRLFENPHLIEQLSTFDEFSKLQIKVDEEYIRNFISTFRFNTKVPSEQLYLAIITLNNHLNNTIDYSIISNIDCLLYYEITRHI